VKLGLSLSREELSLRTYDKNAEENIWIQGGGSDKNTGKIT
jgi:hypothetical protein